MPRVSGLLLMVVGFPLMTATLLGVVHQAWVYAYFGCCGLYIYFRNIQIQKRKNLAAKNVVGRIINQIGTGQNTEKFFLFLRPFLADRALKEERLAIDEIMFGGGFMMADRESFAGNTLEAQLSDSLQGHFKCPVIVVSNPSKADKVEQGAGQISLDVRWEAVVDVLIKHADAIVMIPATSPGTKYELNQMFSDRQILYKTVFVLPGTSGRLNFGGTIRDARQALQPYWSHLKLPNFESNSSGFRLILVDANAINISNELSDPHVEASSILIDLIEHAKASHKSSAHKMANVIRIKYNGVA